MKVVALSGRRKRRRPGSFKGKVWRAPDFDRTPSDSKNYTSFAFCAYADRPLPIGLGQTISQPSLVADMTEALQRKPGDTVLEIGTERAPVPRIIVTAAPPEVPQPLVDQLEVGGIMVAPMVGRP